MHHRDLIFRVKEKENYIRYRIHKVMCLLFPQNVHMCAQHLIRIVYKKLIQCTIHVYFLKFLQLLSIFINRYGLVKYSWLNVIYFFW